MEEFPVQELKTNLIEEIRKIAGDLNSAKPGKIKATIHNEYIIIEIARFLSQGALIVAQTPEGREILASYYEILKEKILKSVPFVKTMEELGIVIQNVFLDINPEKDHAIGVLHLSKAPWLAIS